MDTLLTQQAVSLFARLSSIPHSSGHESALGEALALRLSRLGGVCETDGAGNLRCDLPHSPGREREGRLCFQGHLDMVCAAAPGSGFDPLGDGITCVLDGDILRSDGRSSLGADNLLALAGLLALLESGVRHGPLRLLLTTEEEVGLRGALSMSPRWLDGVCALINLDGFVSGRCLVGCAGGIRQKWSRTVSRTLSPLPGWRVTLSGFPGGHSGFDIAQQGTNPIRLLATVLARADLPVASLTGGHALNAIPTGAEAVVCGGSPQPLLRALEALAPTGTYQVEPVPSPGAVLGDWDRQALLDFLLALPIGVLGWRTDFPAVPAASTNLATVEWEGDTVTVGLFHRASPSIVLQRTARGAAVHGMRCGFDQTFLRAYAPWEGDANSALVKAVGRCWTAVTGEEMEVTAVHVGLEPAVLLREHLNLPAVSLGTDIQNAHSVREEASIPGLSRFLALLSGLLAQEAF